MRGFFNNNRSILLYQLVLVIILHIQIGFSTTILSLYFIHLPKYYNQSKKNTNLNVLSLIKFKTNATATDFHSKFFSEHENLYIR